MTGRSVGSLGSILAAMVWAGAASGETLVDALATAYMNNPTLLAERAAVRAVDENVPQALSGWRPTVEVDGDLGLERSKTNAIRAKTLTPWTTSLSVSQPLYRGGRTEAATNRAESQVAAARARLMTVEQQILRDAAAAYVNVLRDEAVVQLNRNNVQVLSRQLEATRDRFQVGEITRTDVAQAEARLSRSVSDQVQAEGNLASSRAAYERVVGQSPGTLEPAPRLRDLPVDAQSAIGLALDNNPQYQEARHNEYASLHAIDESRGKTRPQVSLNADAQHAEEPSLATKDSDSYSVVARVSFPLYQAGAVDSEIRQSRQVNSQRRIEVEESRRTVVEQVTRSWEAYGTARASISSRKDEVRAAEIALEGVRQESIVGARTTLDVLDAEQELLDARVALVLAERDEFVASFDLAAALGALSAENLELPVDLYDPGVHYQAVRDRLYGDDVPAE
jgi:outer membrane protein